MVAPGGLPRANPLNFPQCLVDGFPAHAKGRSQDGLLLAGSGLVPDVGLLAGGQGWLAALLGPPGLGQGDAFPLTLQDHGSLREGLP